MFCWRPDELQENNVFTFPCVCFTSKVLLLAFVQVLVQSRTVLQFSFVSSWDLVLHNGSTSVWEAPFYFVIFIDRERNVLFLYI